jgi:hypothetical protein
MAWMTSIGDRKWRAAAMLPPSIFTKLHKVRGAHSNRTFDAVEARIACGSVVLSVSFSRKIGSESQFFVKKIW